MCFSQDSGKRVENLVEASEEKEVISNWLSMKLARINKGGGLYKAFFSCSIGQVPSLRIRVTCGCKVVKYDLLESLRWWKIQW